MGLILDIWVSEEQNKRNIRRYYNASTFPLGMLWGEYAKQELCKRIQKRVEDYE